jgi:hypothetical protein
VAIRKTLCMGVDIPIGSQMSRSPFNAAWTFSWGCTITNIFFGFKLHEVYLTIRRTILRIDFRTCRSNRDNSIAVLHGVFLPTRPYHSQNRAQRIDAKQHPTYLQAPAFKSATSLLATGAQTAATIPASLLLYVDQINHPFHPLQSDLWPMDTRYDSGKTQSQSNCMFVT